MLRDAPPLLPVVVVTGLHEARRRQAVLELLEGRDDAVVLHHDLADASLGRVRRVVRGTDGCRRESYTRLVNDCPCCALREDLLPELLRVADARRHGLVVVELWGGSDPRPAVELIAEGETEGRALSGAVRVASVVAAVDPPVLVPQMSVPDALSDHWLHTSGQDRRTVASALAHQIEYAGVLAVPCKPGTAGIPEPHTHTGHAMLRQLHPLARVVTLGTGELAEAALEGFDVAAARDRITPALARLPYEREEAGVSTMLWERRRPLHPTRLYEALEHLVPAAQRSRGRFWLANRPGLMLAWDAAGASLGVQECGPWLATLPDEVWEHYPPGRRAAAALDWHPRYGDRVQRLCFTAEGLDAGGITGLLDSCLLTDAELACGEQGWRGLPDAFEGFLDPVA